MYRPVLVTAPTVKPVSTEEMRRQCRISADDLDPVALAEVNGLLDGYADAAVSLIEGWDGLSGRLLAEQTWRQDFDGFCTCLALPLGPVLSIASVTYRDAAGQVGTVAADQYSLITDAGGGQVCRFRTSFAPPSELGDFEAVSVTYRAGYTHVPPVIKQAILLMVGAWYENREETVIGTIAAKLPDSIAVERLLGKFRKVVI